MIDTFGQFQPVFQLLENLYLNLNEYEQQKIIHYCKTIASPKNERWILKEVQKHQLLAFLFISPSKQVTNIQIYGLA